MLPSVKPGRSQALTDKERVTSNPSRMSSTGLRSLQQSAGGPQHVAMALALQRSAGNSATTQLLGQGQVMRLEEDEGLSFTEIVAEGLAAAWTTKPFARAELEQLADEITDFVAEQNEHSSFYRTGFQLLDETAMLLLKVIEAPGDKTSEADIDAAADVFGRWEELKQRVVESNKAEGKRELRRTEREMMALREQILFAYRDAYAAGKEPSDIEVGAGNLKDVAEGTLTVLTAINDAEAILNGRDVAPLVGVLGKVKSVVGLLAGWKEVPALAASSQEALAKIENIWAAGGTAAGFTAAGPYMIMYAHIGPMLSGIAHQWDKVVSLARQQNRVWWELREVVGDELPYASEEPGGRPVFTYMRDMFKAASAPPGTPADAVVEFFDDRRQMFTRTAREVMDTRGPKTESVFAGFGTEIKPAGLNSWVFDNRDMVWKLIYGRDMKPPNKR